MRKLFTAFLLVVAMLGGAVGVGAHEGEGSCPMTNMPDCCKKAHLGGNAAEVSMARLCCNLNCSEPGSSGTSNSSSISPLQGTTSNMAIVPSVAAFSGFVLTASYLQATSSHYSSPKYIQHLALLI